MCRRMLTSHRQEMVLKILFYQQELIAVSK